VLTFFREYGYEYIEPDAFTSKLNNDCIHFEFTRYINPDNRRGDHIDIRLRCGWYYGCEYRRANKYINRSLGGQEDPNLIDFKTRIEPISFDMIMTCRSLPTSLVSRIVRIDNGKRYMVSGSSIIGTNIRLKHLTPLLMILDTHTCESVPRVYRYFTGKTCAPPGNSIFDAMM
jgi:hypothetical protein